VIDRSWVLTGHPISVAIQAVRVRAGNRDWSIDVRAVDIRRVDRHAGVVPGLAAATRLWVGFRLRRWVITLVQRYLTDGDHGLEPRSRRPQEETAQWIQSTRSLVAGQL
jgi:hypothetical protein